MGEGLRGWLSSLQGQGGRAQGGPSETQAPFLETTAAGDASQQRLEAGQAPCKPSGSDLAILMLSQGEGGQGRGFGVVGGGGLFYLFLKNVLI